MRILVADDELDNRLLLERILGPLGHCDFVADGQEATEAFQFALEEGHPYRLVCLDFQMPAMNGREALQCMREQETEFGLTSNQLSSIFLVTGSDLGDLSVEGLFSQGCTDFLSKPVTRQEMLDKLRTHHLVT
ncbi:MAG: response regulator [Magnetococcales bacterium]|nr:response regulator [Magnetococcales bacterium]MBF0308021.1 response regulator [Magnetococcales bacterium]